MDELNKQLGQIQSALVRKTSLLFKLRISRLKENLELYLVVFKIK